MKPLYILSLFFLLSIETFSQVRLAANSPDQFKSVMEAVLHDVPLNFHSISGDLVLAQGEFEQFASTVKLPGAIDCVVMRFHSVDDTTASWRARMFKGENFQGAAKVYNQLFRQLKGCYLKLVDGSIVNMVVEGELATEEMPFTVSTFWLATGDARYKNVKVELELLSELTEWAVNINVVTKERDDIDRHR